MSAMYELCVTLSKLANLLEASHQYQRIATIYLIGFLRYLMEFRMLSTQYM